MSNCIHLNTLIEMFSNWISIATPIVLLIWFFFSQKLALSKMYFNELEGTYAGFTKPIYPVFEDKKVTAGIIMKIRDVDDKGYFKGDFIYAEVCNSDHDRPSSINPIRNGEFIFFGEIAFKSYLNRKRHPFSLSDNRKYCGKLYIVSRLDFNFEDYKIDQYLVAEYDIIHWREMQTFKFLLSKKYKNS